MGWRLRKSWRYSIRVMIAMPDRMLSCKLEFSLLAHSLLVDSPVLVESNSAGFLTVCEYLYPSQPLPVDIKPGRHGRRSDGKIVTEIKHS